MSPGNSANGSNKILFHEIIILDHPQTFGSKSVQQMFKNWSPGLLRIKIHIYIENDKIDQIILKEIIDVDTCEGVVNKFIEELKPWLLITRIESKLRIVFQKKSF